MHESTSAALTQAGWLFAGVSSTPVAQTTPEPMSATPGVSLTPTSTLPGNCCNAIVSHCLPQHLVKQLLLLKQSQHYT